MYGVLIHGKNGCTMSYEEIRDISKLVKKEFPFSASYFWMWKMFQIGFAYGKAEERKRRK